MIGANLGVNPSLTITALAEHVCSRIPAKRTEPAAKLESEAVTTEG